MKKAIHHDVILAMTKMTFEDVDSFWNYDPNKICHLVDGIVYWETTSKKLYVIKYVGTQRVNINIMQMGTK